MWSIFPTLPASLSLLAVSPILPSLPPVAAEEFASRRAALAREIQDGVFFFEGAKEAALETRYFQDDDFYYLTGVETQDAALLLVAKRGKIVEETLFLPPKDPAWERWNGERLAPGKDVAKRFGVRETASNKTIEDSLAQVAAKASKVFSPTEKGSAKSSALRKQLEGKKIQALSPRVMLDLLQVCKSPAEIVRVERAVQITERGFEAAAALIRPGVYEFELMGALEGSYLRHGAEGFAFPSIVGSGPHSCQLHYTANRRQMLEGELVLIDAGAKFEHYRADITRTFPVSGKFSPRQAEVYNLVLEAQKKALEAAKPGAFLGDVHHAARNFLQEKGVAKHFWHSTSHFLGLKTHDTSTAKDEPLRPGTIFTIEPGLYFPEENLGVRIEDDILITEDGCRILSNGIPREIEEVEAWIRKLRQ